MTDLIEVKTVDLVGPALDWAVAQVEGVKTLMLSPRKGEPQKPFALFGSLALSIGGEDQSSYAPSTCWHCGGPLIDRFQVELLRAGPVVHAKLHGLTDAAGSGDTSLIAACRAIVSAKLGDTAQVPKELMP